MAYILRGTLPFAWISPLIPQSFPTYIFLGGKPPEPVVFDFLEDAERGAKQMDRAYAFLGAVFEVEQIPDPEPIPEPR